MTFREAFNAKVDILLTQHTDDRVCRIAEINAIVSQYTESHGERPPSDVLEKLADYILYEEIHDTHPDKMTRNEYPIMSDRQEKTRRDREYPLHSADTYDANRVNQARPYRRKRSKYEEYFIDKISRNNNRARNARYKRDTSPGQVESYNLRETGGEVTEPFVSAAECSDKWTVYIAQEDVINAT